MPSTLLEQQQDRCHHHSLIRAEAVVDLAHGRVGDELAGDAEFVVGQFVDEFLARPDCLGTVEVRDYGRGGLDGAAPQ